MAILLIGLNHKSAPVEVREKVSLSRPQIEKLSEKIRQVQSFSGCTIRCPGGSDQSHVQLQRTDSAGAGALSLHQI